MFSLLQENISLLNDSALWEGMDNISVGLFILNQEGFFVRVNETAARIFGIDDNLNRDEHHISKVDGILSTGLNDKFNDIVTDSTEFVLQNIRCTNCQGNFMILNVFCRGIYADTNNDRLVIGAVIDIYNNTLPPIQSSSQLQELRILTEVASALASSNELNQILQVILTGATASQGLGFNRAFLFLYDNHTNMLNGYLAVGPSSAEEASYIWNNLDGMCLSLSELLDNGKNGTQEKIDLINDLIKNFKIDLNKDSLICNICQKNTWINLENVSDIDSITLALINHLGTKKMALVPMLSKGRLMGLLAADNFITQNQISDNAVQLLQFLANQAAVAMERAGLYEEQKERTLILEQTNNLLAESQEHIINIEKMSVIGELTSSIAHELRNPLTIIGGFAGMMLKTNITEEQREYLNIISGETKRAETVLDHVLDFSKASKSENTEIDFSLLVEKTLKVLLGRMRTANNDISLSLDRQKMIIYGNYDHLSHAFYQFFKLVTNDLTPLGKVEVRTEKKNDKAIMLILINREKKNLERTIKTLKQIFSENNASQRLGILVAGEAIKLHGGDFGLSGTADDQVPSLYIELPLLKEDDNLESNINS